MLQLLNTNSDKKYSSLFLVEQINAFRLQEGNRKELLHKSFLIKIETEFEDEIAGQNILPSSYKDSTNRNLKMYELTFE